MWKKGKTFCVRVPKVKVTICHFTHTSQGIHYNQQNISIIFYERGKETLSVTVLSFIIIILVAKVCV